MSDARDLNLDIAGDLRDMSIVHSSPHGRLAYKNAARAVLNLEEPLDVYATKHQIREIPSIGASSERVIREHLERGRSATAEAAVEKSGRREEVRAAHAYRSEFMSRAEALRLLNAPLKGVIGRGDYLGDLQTHTVWSDGAKTIAGMAGAAMERGHRYIGISDHSHGLRIARGMSMEDVTRQHEEIDELNRGWKGKFRVVKAVEANIPAEGGVDMEPGELARFEIVLAAAHSRLRGAEDQTERMLATVRHPAVHVLAHPRGRMYSRQGVLARWDDVFEEASRRGVAIELDGSPYRQDLDHTLARRALDAGCLFALDSDAHSDDELAYTEFALAHARRAGIPADRVINTWPAARLLEWAKSR